MPTRTSWYINKDNTQEILEVVATDAHDGITEAREQLINMAATIMQHGSNPQGMMEVPLGIEVTQPGSRSLKMVVAYKSQGKHNLSSRMIDRRRVFVHLAAA